MQLAHRDTTETSVWEFMTESHRQLDKLFHRVVLAFEADDPDTALLWHQLESGLLSHMDAEERFVLPAFARVDRTEAHALLREHGKIREQLLELGVALELHHLRAEQSRWFVASLHAHAEREHQLLYRWADTRLDARIANVVRRHLEQLRD